MKELRRIRSRPDRLKLYWIIVIGWLVGSGIAYAQSNLKGYIFFLFWTICAIGAFLRVFFFSKNNRNH
jgi:hypothetical protein